jgi:hypothetical protein
MGWSHLKIFSQTTKPEWLRITQKLSEILQIRVCKNHCPWGLDGATMGKTIFTGVYFFKEIFSLEPAGQFQSNLVQIILR